MNYKIAAYDVEFPHKAYGVQLGFMDKVLKALDSKSNALLEAPTGSGKTLSLLCAALAWQRQQKIDLIEPQCDLQKQSELDSDLDEPQEAAKDSVKVDNKQKQKKRCTRIYYATRTHSQIAQVCFTFGSCFNLQHSELQAQICQPTESAFPGRARTQENNISAKNGLFGRSS